MASVETIKGSPIGALKHDLREHRIYRNEDIDPEKSHLNYVIASHGNTAKECHAYYDSLLDGIYIRDGKTIHTAQWVVTAPQDLEPTKNNEFFRVTYDFLNYTLFGGDDDRCLLATVHKDEGGQEHMHYVFTFPEVDNKKYITIEKKLERGINTIAEKYDINISSAQKVDLERIVMKYEASNDSAREREAIHSVSEILDLKRDEARWAFTRCRRLDSEMFKKKLMSSGDFITKDLLKGFHGSYQKWLDDHGIDCTVYRGGTGINMTVDQLKDMTKGTGLTLVDKGEIVRLNDKIKSLEEQILKDKDVDQSEWGENPWKGDKTWSVEW